MRHEDKQVDGPELERDAALRGSELEEEQDEELLPDLATEHQVDPAIEHRGQLLGAMRMILAREHLIVSRLGLPQREQRALEALQAAVTGKSTNLDQFVFAEDRGQMLEQALAILQANLTRGDDRAVAELHAKFGTLVEQVAQLRGNLKDLADGQDELLEANQKVGHALAETDTGDKPKPTDTDTSLTGPERPQPAQASTLSGPDLPPERPPPSTLSGADLPPERPQPSTLSGADLPPDRAQPSTLSGADLPTEAAPESSVWDAGTPIPPPPIVRAQELQPQEPEAPAGKKPWWRRPFG